MKQFQISEAREGFTDSQTCELLKPWLLLSLPSSVPAQHTEIHSEMQKATYRLKGGGKGLRRTDGRGTTGIKGKQFGIQAKRQERNKRKGGKRKREREEQNPNSNEIHYDPSSFCVYGLPDFFSCITSPSNTKKQS